MSDVCVGLFGTCGNSEWRNPFIKLYTYNDIPFFNPDAGDNWHPGMIADENKHLKEDSIILFPVLAETTGFGSLGEIGFSVLNAIRNIHNGSGQYLITMIDDDCNDKKATNDERKHSIKTRKLVKSKLLAVNHPNVIVVDNLPVMLTASIEVINIIKTLNNIKKYSIIG